MKRIIPIVLLTAMVAGCATSSMKSTPFYTGSERVYTGRIEDRVNFWPLGYYREPALSVLWPIYSQADDHLAVRPFYSQYRHGGVNSGYDEFNFLWPFFRFDARHDAYRIFPLVWWKKDRYFNVFPLWWSDSRHKLLIPFYFQDENSFNLVPFYGRTDYIDGFTQWIGPYGRHRGEKEDENYDWCIPFYYRDVTSFKTMLFGWNRNFRSSWAFPFYYKDYSHFVSLPWISGHDAYEDWWFVPPLLSWGTRSADGWSQQYLLGLGGVRAKGDGEISGSWVFPFYCQSERAFLSLPFGYADGFTYVTPFVGVVHKERKKGGWLWPLFGWENDIGMDAAEAKVNADRLDPQIAADWLGVKGAVGAHGGFWWLCWLGSYDHWIRWRAKENRVTATDSTNFGNSLVYKRMTRRKVTFDAKTREKVRDECNRESGLFGNLLWHSSQEEVDGRCRRSAKSILWRFWHYENADGDVSVDSLPFFTYDSKTNGYSKTSLCWRLFRNEYDPKTDARAVDFLFIPVWR